jgi:hypothetical protein
MDDTASILSGENMAAVRHHLNFVGYVVVLHKHLFSARGPTPLAFSDIDDFEAYLAEQCKPGDKIIVWPFPPMEAPTIAYGKLPEADGTIRTGGAY